MPGGFTPGRYMFSIAVFELVIVEGDKKWNAHFQGSVLTLDETSF